MWNRSAGNPLCRKEISIIDMLFWTFCEFLGNWSHFVFLNTRLTCFVRKVSVKCSETVVMNLHIIGNTFVIIQISSHTMEFHHSDWVQIVRDCWTYLLSRTIGKIFGQVGPGLNTKRTRSDFFLSYTKNRFVCTNLWCDKNWTLRLILYGKISDCVLQIKSDKIWSEMIGPRLLWSKHNNSIVISTVPELMHGGRDSSSFQFVE